jgi:predicted PhzF superfamily epimerase YddE/YHI9
VSEAGLLEKFRAAMTPAMIDTLARAANGHLEGAFQQHATRIDQLKAEILGLEREARNLVRFLAHGGESPTVREELRARESALQGLRADPARLLEREPTAAPRVHPGWISAKIERLDQLLRADPVRAKAELAKHLDGELVLTPLPSAQRERRAEVRGRAKLNGLLEGQEAVLQYVGCGGWI